LSKKPCCPECAEKDARSSVMARYQDGGPVLPDLDRERRANFFRRAKKAVPSFQDGGQVSLQESLEAAQQRLDEERLQQRLAEASPLERNVYETLGLEPGLDRGVFLPVAYGPGGERELATPALIYDFLRAASAPGAALRGVPVSDQEIVESALEFTGGGLTFGPSVEDALGMAVKTRGGVFGAQEAPSESVFQRGTLPDLLYGYKARLIDEGMSESDAETVVKKARKFYTTEFGTESDRLRQMMRDEEIPAQSTEDVSSTEYSSFGLQPFIQRARTADVLRGEQIAPVRAEFERLQNMRSRSGQFDGFDTIEDYNKFIAARNELNRLTRVDAPDVEPTDAMKAFESQYDRATGLGGIFLGDQARNSTDVKRRIQDEVAKESQYPNEIPQGINLIEDPLNPTYSSDEITGFDFVNDPTYARAMENQEVIYDINARRFDEGLQFLSGESFAPAVADLNLSSDELAKISFPELVKRSVVAGSGTRRAKQAASQADNVLGSFFRQYSKYGPVDEPKRQELLNRVPKEVKFEGLEEVLPGSEKTWHRITDPNWTQLEGAMMGHSVGGYATPGSSYNLGGRKAFNEGAARVYTLRNNETGNPTVTVDVDFSDPSNPKINQVHGPNDDKIGMRDIDELYALFDELNIDPDEGFKYGSGREYRSSYKFYKDTDAAFTPEALSRRQEEQLLFAEPEGPAEQRAGFEPEQVREFQRGQEMDPEQERRRAGIRGLFGLGPDDLDI
jgi:hypothetical protein